MKPSRILPPLAASLGLMVVLLSLLDSATSTTAQSQGLHGQGAPFVPPGGAPQLRAWL